MGEGREKIRRERRRGKKEGEKEGKKGRREGGKERKKRTYLCVASVPPNSLKESSLLSFYKIKNNLNY